jgi:glucuronate isomerase
MIGSDIEKGLLPDDRKFIGGLIRDICYFNARNYFDFPNSHNQKHPVA